MDKVHYTAVLLAFSIMLSAFFVYSQHQVGSKLAAAVISSQTQSTTLENRYTAHLIPTLSNDLIFTDFSLLGTTDQSTSSESLEKVESEIISETILSKPKSIELKSDSFYLVNSLIDLSNLARKNNNLDSLKNSAELASYAQKRSVDMATNNYLSHTSQNDCNLACHWNESKIATLAWGENLAEFTPYSSTLDSVIAETLITRWLESSGHRENLLSKEFTHFGIGTAVNNERLVVTVIFGNL